MAIVEAASNILERMTPFLPLAKASANCGQENGTFAAEHITIWKDERPKAP
jgi:hypothetical protein